jgi:uncharacterized protein (DUF58 family)
VGRFTLPREGVLWLATALLLSGLGWWKSMNLVILIGYFMLFVLAFNAYLASRNARRARVEHKETPPLFAGEEAIVELHISNEGNAPATVLVEDQADGVLRQCLIDGLPPHATAPWNIQRVFPARGIYPSLVRIASAYPFGLIRYVLPARTSQFLILPRLGTADAEGMKRWLFQKAAGNEVSAQHWKSLAGEQTDVRGLRPYREGDPLRTIHWRTSARRGELMVCEYDTASSRDLVLVVEPWLPENPTLAQRRSLEEGLSLAATLARAWSRECRTGVTVVVAGAPETLRASGTEDESLRTTLAVLGTVAGRDQFETLEPTIFDQSLKRAVRIIVSSRAGSPYPAMLERSTGHPFQCLAVGETLPWYAPPVSEKKAPGSRRPGVK